MGALGWGWGYANVGGAERLGAGLCEERCYWTGGGSRGRGYRRGALLLVEGRSNSGKGRDSAYGSGATSVRRIAIGLEAGLCKLGGAVPMGAGLAVRSIAIGLGGWGRGFTNGGGAKLAALPLGCGRGYGREAFLLGGKAKWWRGFV